MTSGLSELGRPWDTQVMSTPSRAPAITLIGPGAIGAALAAGLVEAGHIPTLVTRTPFDRLRVEWPLGSVDVAARCVTAVDVIEPADVVIVATKATQNAAIGDQVRAAVRADSVLLIAQNGVDHLERFAVEANVVPAIVMLPSERIGPGQAKVGSPSRLVIPEGQSAARVQSIFENSFIDVEVTAEWTSAAWLKLMMNAAVGGIGVLTRRGSDVFHDVDALNLLQALMEEVATVGRAEGAVLPDELPSQLRRYQEKNAGGHTTSIVVDRLAEQPTEWRERNQAVVDAAKRHGIDVPLNQTVATLMRLGEPSSG
jgi:2-dehydropantoate 2-reductase